ncbi:hypothetical protein WBG78_29935 [Chryseolinea sp. T2]|uniref:hypothetical protein n=1 Tax=Chryseolinea sp. T2 TaxID=3129255 RepID=UPI0030788314
MLADLSNLQPRPYKLKQLAELCGVSTRTMSRHINKLGDVASRKIGHFFTFPVVKEILQRLGYI